MATKEREGQKQKGGAEEAAARARRAARRRRSGRARGRGSAGPAAAPEAATTRRRCATRLHAAVRLHEPAPDPDAREDRAERRRGRGDQAAEGARHAWSRSSAMITGQRPVRKKAKKSIANFGLREGQEIGAAVTLRGARMWEFLDRFVNVAMPRIRDFRGAEHAVVRRARQLFARRQGADDLPGDQLRHGRADPRDGHHVRDDARTRTTRRSRCCASWACRSAATTSRSSRSSTAVD